jgi:hypothetical protein
MCRRATLRSVLRRKVVSSTGSPAVKPVITPDVHDSQPSVSDSAWLVASTARRMSWVAASGCDTNET